MNKEKITPEELFKDAEFLYQEAIEELAKGKIRNAAEKGWGATLRATNGLILARIGEEPENPTRARILLDEIAAKNPKVERKLEARFHTNRDSLHGDCFYTGICEPKDVIERRIRGTLSFIEDARRLVNQDRSLK